MTSRPSSSQSIYTHRTILPEEQSNHETFGVPFGELRESHSQRASQVVLPVQLATRPHDVRRERAWREQCAMFSLRSI
jgi:hypothetical protein